MSNTRRVHVGVDVGGTNTDAVVFCENEIIGWSKQVTTDDVTTGVVGAIISALDCAANFFDHGIEGVRFNAGIKVNRVHVGTTHFINAVLQKRDLVPVAVIRLCGSATQSLPPLSDFNPDLKKIVGGPVFMISGGYMFDGEHEIRPLDKTEVEDCVQQIRDCRLSHIVVSGVFSPVNNSQEIQVGKWIKELYPKASVTLSHEVAQLGLLLRENSAVLNECLKPLSVQTMTGLRNALDKLKLCCPLYITQNDGTLLSSTEAQKFPVLTFSSGATNSMRGAAYLSGVKDAVILDVGGTSTDSGVLKGGFPRPASSKVEVGGVLTNFQMPDTLSIPLGGGSLVRFSGKNGSQVLIGPQSVGNRVRMEAVAFGGHTLTTTDVAVGEGLADLGTFENKSQWLPGTSAKAAGDKVHDMVADLVDRIKTSKELTPLILVGGGSIIVDTTRPIPGTSEVIKPPHFQVANAVGAALSQVSGQIDSVESLASKTREEAVENAKQQAKDLAIKKGADPATVEIMEVTEFPVSYLPGNVIRIQVKAVGDIRYKDHPGGVKWKGGVTVGALISPTVAKSGKKAVDNETVADLSLEQMSLAESGGTSASRSMTTEFSDVNIDPLTGEWILSEQDVENIAVGAGILGCGGGGNPQQGKIAICQQIRMGKKIRVISAKRFSRLAGEHGHALPISLMGAPTVVLELLPGEVQHSAAVKALKDLYEVPDFDENDPLQCLDLGEENVVEEEAGVNFISNFKKPHQQNTSPGKEIAAVFTFEIGGGNSMEQFFLAAKWDLPVIDCDTMGRAFPEFQMLTSFIYGVPCYPVALGDFNGNNRVILHAETAKQVEDSCRKACVEMGCVVSLCGRPLTASEVGEKTVLCSLSRAWKLGQAVFRARALKASPVEAILKFENGKLLCTAKICDIEKKTAGGFVRGEMKLEGMGDFKSQQFMVSFQNENLIMQKLLGEGRKEVLATVPDLISLVVPDTGEPYSTEELRYGLRVAVISLPAPPKLTTHQALAVVGPRAFGYDMDYHPIGVYLEHGSVLPE